MTSLSSIMSMASSGLSAYQTAISVAGNNIANAGVSGYSRQAVVLASDGSGSGVEAAEVRRINDAFWESRIRQNNQELSKYETQQEYTAALEAVFMDTDEYGLNAAMNEFWNAWQDLAANPSGSSERVLAASAAQTLAGTFNDLASGLMEIQTQAGQEAASMVGAVNRISLEIASLNREISLAEAGGQSANSLRDSREALVEDLAGLVDINVSEGENGWVGIQLADGKPLVEGDIAWSLDTAVNASTGLVAVTWINTGGDVHTVSCISGGALGGCLEVRNELIPEYLERLDELASTMIERVNAVHSSGYNLEGDTGVLLFDGSDAATMTVNPGILEDGGLIAASDSADGVPGDGGAALALTELTGELALDGGNSTFGEFYAALVSDIGALTQSVDDLYQSRSDLATVLENQRESVSGVSVDEEMIKLTLYQAAYEAAARVISMVEELLDTVNNM